MARLVRRPRGRKAHLEHCRHVRERDVRSAPDAAECCAECCPTCVVCASAPGRPVDECPLSHGLCDDCAGVHFTHEGDAARLPRCPCGAGGHIDVRAMPLRQFEAWADAALSPRVTAAAAPAASPTAQLVERVCDDAFITRCPWCARGFDSFDGCAAVRCDGCQRYFCGLCLQRCSDAAQAHGHAAGCAHNPTWPRTYFVPREEVETILERRGERRMLETLRAVAAKDGTLLALALARATGRLRSSAAARRFYAEAAVGRRAVAAGRRAARTALRLGARTASWCNAGATRVQRREFAEGFMSLWAVLLLWFSLR